MSNGPRNSEKGKTPLLNVYSLQDVLAGRFHPPFLAENDAVAKRIISQAANTPDSQICDNPNDFRLWHLGNFDQDDGQLDSFKTPEFIVSVIDLVQQPTTKK